MDTGKTLIKKNLKELREKKKQNQKKSTLFERLEGGEKAILEDRVVPHSDARKRMSRWLD